MGSEYKKRKNKRNNYVKEEQKIELEDEIEIIDDEEKTKEDKRKLTNGEKIFIIINILVIIGIIGYYAYRVYYYYTREHYENNDVTLKEKLTKLENITYQNDGLYENNGYFYYKGIDVDNYLYYSGRMFRIISISDDIKMIEEDNITNLVWGINSSYSDSIINKWLGNYLETYKDYDVYLKKNNWCNDKVDINDYKCSDNLENYVGLLSTKEYLNAGGVNSYLNNDSYYWTINFDSDNKAYFVNKSGEINNIVNNNDNYFSYGVRPVVVLSGDLIYRSGTGKKENPYIIEEENSSLLKENSIGSFVKYNNYLFRILDIDDDGVSLILADELEIEKKYTDINKYLNNEFIKKFNKDELIKRKSNTNIYNYDNKYNYLESINEINNYITIPKISDLFINESVDYWLSTISDKKLNIYYTIDNNKMFFGDLVGNTHKVRPIIKVKSDLIVSSGTGLYNNPLVLGDL